MKQYCAICGCELHRGGEYATPTIQGRSHATEHHYVAERFFGRSRNRPQTQREAIFPKCPWNSEGKTVIFCYECHEELIHNPVFLPKDIEALNTLVRAKKLNEDHKTESREKIAGRIKLLHKIITAGLKQISEQASP